MAGNKDKDEDQDIQEIIKLIDQSQDLLSDQNLHQQILAIGQKNKIPQLAIELVRSRNNKFWQAIANETTEESMLGKIRTEITSSIVPCIFNRDNTLNKADLNFISKYFRDLGDISGDNSETLHKPNDNQTLNYQQVQAIFKILSKAYSKDLCQDDTNFIQVDQSKAVIIAGQPVVKDKPSKQEEGSIAKNITQQFWETILTYWKKGNDPLFPSKIILINYLNVNLAHWTTAVSEIEFDQEQADQIITMLNSINATEQRVNTDLIQQYIKQQQQKKFNGCLPVKSIKVNHYNSCNTDAKQIEEYLNSQVIFLTALTPNQEKFNFKLNKCGGQVSNECGDCSAVHSFIAAILGELDVTKRVKQLLLNTGKQELELRKLTIECVELYLQLQQLRMQEKESSPEHERDIILKKAQTKNSAIKEFFDKLKIKISLPEPVESGEVTDALVVSDELSPQSIQPLEAAKALQESTVSSNTKTNVVAPPTLELKKPPERFPVSPQQVDRNIITDSIDRLLPEKKACVDVIKNDFAKKQQIRLNKQLETTNTNKQKIIVEQGSTLSIVEQTQDVIQCPIVGIVDPNGSTNQHLIIEQQEIFINFLLLQQEKLRLEQSSLNSHTIVPLTVEVSNFNPIDLESFLTAIIKNKECSQLANYIKLKVNPQEVDLKQNPLITKLLEEYANLTNQSRNKYN